MNPYLIVGVGALLLAIFLLVVAGMVWQEARRRGFEQRPPYVMEDAVSFAWERLPDDVRSRLRKSDVRRIFEWEIYYLQGLADRWAKGVDIVAGSEQGIRYIQTQIAAHHQADYSEDEVRAVLALEAEYLESIGAVGDRVGEIAS